MIDRQTLELVIAPIHKRLDEVKDDVRELRADHKSLREKMEHGFATLSAKLEKVSADFNARLEKVSTDFSAKLEKVSTDSNAKLEKLSSETNAKLEKLSVEVSDLRGMQKAILWVIGIGMALWPILIATGKALHWF